MKTLALWLLWLVIRAYALMRHRFDIVVEGKLYLSRWYLTPHHRDADDNPIGLELWWRKRYRAYFLHCFHESDPNRGWRSHPWFRAESLILRGSYTEYRSALFSPTVLALMKAFQAVARSMRSALGLEPSELWPDCMWSETYGPGDVNVLTAQTFHRVKLLTPKVWSLFRAGELHGAEWEFMAEDGTRTPHGTPTRGD